MTKSVKNIILTFSLGCIIYLIGNLWFNGFNYNSVNDFVIDFMFYQLYAFVLGYSNMVFFQYFYKSLWLKGNKVLRFIIGIIGASVITLVGLFLLHAFSALLIQGKSFSAFLENERIEHYTFGFWITLNVVIIYHIVYYYNAY